ncbi:paraquat-inducible protein A [Acinetobacter larvae]|uniref:Paraquat-inducible membrane protein A n=1 Tax=Acinetobacter larvae TaxID=1789224 RepID=A0A1B2M2X1_9GAMM|nr:paraquat-inducible protein A [Acinetobacter larvae]AOA59524.1 paraquat-inducible membrane protein A [Acinetobacter larvae]
MTHKNKQPCALESHLQQNELVGCEECDALYLKVKLLSNERVYCTCCGAELYRRSQSFSSLLALVITALIIFVIANSFPIVIIELQGNTSQTTLIGAAWTMFHIDRPFVGALILMTTFIVPFIELLLLSYILSCVGLLQYRPRYLKLAFRLLFAFRTWGMVEVFLIGVLVTLVKLVAMVTIIPGVALWAFTILSMLMVYIASIKIKDLWNEVDRSLA